MIPLKYCPMCNRDLSLDYFTPSQRERPNVYCAECQRAFNRQYYKENKARLDKVNRAYAVEHRDEIRAYQRQYKADNPRTERDKFTDQERYKRKRDEIRAAQRAYQRQHPEMSARRTMRYYARKLRADGDHTAAQWKALRAWFGERCVCCGATRKIEADHVISLQLGGSDWIENIQPLCRSCNAAKATASIDYRDPDDLAAFLASLLD